MFSYLHVEIHKLKKARRKLPKFTLLCSEFEEQKYATQFAVDLIQARPDPICVEIQARADPVRADTQLVTVPNYVSTPRLIERPTLKAKSKPLSKAAARARSSHNISRAEPAKVLTRRLHA